jgi:hypothetical protein
MIASYLVHELYHLDQLIITKEPDMTYEWPAFQAQRTCGFRLYIMPTTVTVTPSP